MIHIAINLNAISSQGDIEKNKRRKKEQEFVGTYGVP
jgi:hypothetical protein